MSYVYYCKKCRSVYSSDVDNKENECPECHEYMVATHMDINTWRSKTKEEKEKLKKIFDGGYVKTNSHKQSSNPIRSLRDGFRSLIVFMYTINIILCIIAGGIIGGLLDDRSGLLAGGLVGAICGWLLSAVMYGLFATLVYISETNERIAETNDQILVYLNQNKTS